MLGIDGLDPVLLDRFMNEGRMPVFKEYIRSHYFSPLRTTLPPQSPVAWSSFITGSNPGKHGIFDFIHRDPASFLPHLSTSRTTGTDRSIRLGKWSLPLGGAHVELLRHGEPFWNPLTSQNIPVTLFKLPANFPVSPGEARAISGMGTPDLLGTYGTYTLVTEEILPDKTPASGGRVHSITMMDHQAGFNLEGPPNTFRSDGQPTAVRFIVNRDPVENVIRIRVPGEDLLLRQGEWSDWVPLEFEMFPVLASARGMVRLYVQAVHPRLRLYISPVNMDPADPDMPISNPRDYSKELTAVLGRFYTQGFPEDTKALSHGVFTDLEFLTQGRRVLEERLEAFDFELNRFDEGLLFFYFSSIDQNSHMMLRTMMPDHPLYDPDAAPEVREALPFYYSAMDDVLRQTLAKMDSSTRLIICSDHGFAPFTREFHLSTWLVDNGFTAAGDRELLRHSEFFNGVDWTKTRAYALGLNSVYLNLRGRERMGSLFPDAAPRVLDELIDRLLSIRDPANGRRVIQNVYRGADVYRGGRSDQAPDLIIGYADGYRISDEAAFGRFPDGVLGDRIDKWSADHCMDPAVVPGVLVTDLPVRQADPALWDLAPTILKAYGLEPQGQMDGRSLI